VKETMHFCLLTPDGAITPDTFRIAERQPTTILEGCVLVVHEASGRQMTVHRTRLIPISESQGGAYRPAHNACPKCGKVEGIVLDNVVCPHHGGANCGLLETSHTHER
jgi:hypothetical protein